MNLFGPLRQPPPLQHKQFAVWPATPTPTTPVGLIVRCAWLCDEPLPFAPAVGSCRRLGSAICTVLECEKEKLSYAELATSAPVKAATLVFRRPPTSRRTASFSSRQNHD
jgi:hypothetical protein